MSVWPTVDGKEVNTEGKQKADPFLLFVFICVNYGTPLRRRMKWGNGLFL
ncbi:hypothetical protein [Ammoniphilus sp. YIM 78166]|nr:hypothetical protein [Ammoniphilus sp. YIM 78166]